MKSPASSATAVDEYIASFPPDVRARLAKVRATIRRHAPNAEERMSYGIPTFFLDGNLVHFAAFARHVGFYPGPSGIAAFKDALSRYKSAKGSVQFPHDEPLPLGLIGDIVKFRVAESTAPKAKRSRGTAKKETRGP
jgi:uncharacterized protein YdhG (YjbR/CyaY superfamily)